MQIIKLKKPLSMTSKQIAELTGKRHDHVIRDIKKMFDNLGSAPSFGETSYLDSQGKKQPMYILNERETLCLVTKYNDTLRMKIIDQWQQMRDALEVLRYRKEDAIAQVEAMAVIHEFLTEEEKKEKLPYIKANTVVNKITSDVFGMPKMLKKEDMNFYMLQCRTQALEKYVKLFECGFSNREINNLLRQKLIKK